MVWNSPTIRDSSTSTVDRSLISIESNWLTNKLRHDQATKKIPHSLCYLQQSARATKQANGRRRLYGAGLDEKCCHRGWSVCRKVFRSDHLTTGGFPRDTFYKQAIFQRFACNSFIIFDYIAPAHLVFSCVQLLIFSSIKSARWCTKLFPQLGWSRLLALPPSSPRTSSRVSFTVWLCLL